MVPLDPTPVVSRRLYRRADGRMVAGVAHGLADHLGFDVLVVRLVFVVLAAAGGSGVVMYALFWVFAPLEPTTGASQGSDDRDVAPLIALASLALGVLLLFAALGTGFAPQLVVPMFAVAFGVVMLWRQADDAQRERVRAVTGSGPWSGISRTIVGALLVLGGAGAIVAGPVNVRSAAGTFLAILVLAAGLALVSAPWWLRMARDLSAERSARIREQERAEVAAHVHDSVLHTLTLIQRNVDDPREVARLVRAQERELRGWLYTSAPAVGSTVRFALERAAADVEDAHGSTVEVVVVGDCPLDERLTAMMQATREALINAAKYAGATAIAVYAEVEPEKVTVFVRDRGPGFSVDAVPADRLGIRQSLVGRMARNGGSAVVRSSAGEGTEVQLEMPRR